MRIVDALLKSGADVNLYTSKGEQAYQLSTNEHIAKVLMTKDAVAKARKQRQHSGSGGNRSRDNVSLFMISLGTCSSKARKEAFILKAIDYSILLIKEQQL